MPSEIRAEIISTQTRLVAEISICNARPEGMKELISEIRTKDPQFATIFGDQSMKIKESLRVGELSQAANQLYQGKTYQSMQELLDDTTEAQKKLSIENDIATCNTELDALWEEIQGHHNRLFGN